MTSSGPTNYDRSLEHCFRKIIEARYGHDELRAQEIWERRPEIVHLHGILGHYDPLDDQHRPYAPPPDAKSLFGAASAIQIISDADPSTPDFVRARELLDGAVRIIFLGFGFDIKNVLRLRVFEEKVNCDKVDSTYRLHGHRDRRWVIETVFNSQIDESALKNIPIDTYMDEHF